MLQALPRMRQGYPAVPLGTDAEKRGLFNPSSPDIVVRSAET
jgi:hypothetical protein